MAFWVEEVHEPSQGNSENYQELGPLDIVLLATGKRANLSFEEMNEMRVQDLLDYIKVFVGQQPTGRKETRRMATQEDIDRFFTGL